MGEGVENFDEIAPSPTVKEIEAFLCFLHFFDENSKWPLFLKKFSKVGVVGSLHRNPGGRKFRRNHSIYNG